MNLESITKPISCLSLLFPLPEQIYSLPVESEQPDETLAHVKWDDLLYFSKPVKFDKSFNLENKISGFKNLASNWDGYGSTTISQKVISNALQFLKTIDEPLINDIDPESLTPTPYGTIVIDIENKNDLLSIEIGESKIGFFTDFEAKQNISSDGEIYTPNSIPSSLSEAIWKMYRSSVS